VENSVEHLRVLFVYLTMLSIAATALHDVIDEQELEQESEGSCRQL
jgi:hypothetical protein